MKVIFLCLAILAMAHAQVTNWGPCPANINAKIPFQMSTFTGEWREWQKWGGSANDRCIKHKFDAATGQYNITLKAGNATNTPLTNITGTFVMTAVPSAEMDVYLSSNLGVPVKYKILDTDYESFAVIYSCADVFGVSNTQQLFTIGKAPFLLLPVEMRINEVLTRNNLQNTTFTNIDQLNC